MSSALLDKLKVKPIPKQKPAIAVGLARGEPTVRQMVNIATKIVDRTGLPPRDISRIRSRLATSKQVQDVRPGAQPPAPPLAPIPEVIPSIEPRPEEKTEAQPEPQPLPRVEEEERAQDIREADQDEGPSQPAAKPRIVLKRPRLVMKKAEEVPTVPTGPFDKPKVRITKGPISLLRIGDTIVPERLPPKKPEVLVRASSYYMSNREIFLNFISSLFRKYKDEIDNESADASCDSRQTGDFTALAHQNLVRDYLNIYTPYRGLLLYHGLGSGKTCSSIGIAEGLKNHKEVMVLTPASLRANFYKELKKCGDPIFKKNQYWEFIKTGNNDKLIDAISKALSLPVETINKQGGAWMVNIQKPSNYSSLTAPQQRQLDSQLNSMIESKYQFINYNGLRKSHMQSLSANGTRNPFDNKVVIIEEAHNFVSRIANKIATGDSGSLSLMLYDNLLRAKNVKIVMLTGTPIINYPNELGIMFNILRGYIKTFILKLNVLSSRKVNEDSIRQILSKVSVADYVEYAPSTTTLTITKNPFGFVNVNKKGVYEGVVVGERGDIDDDQFLRIVVAELLKNDIEVAKGVRVREFKALPETLNDFKAYFIEEDGFTVKNINLLKRRIMGLASYFRSAQEQLLPTYNKSIDFHVIKVPMSDFQFEQYEDARKNERELEKRNAQKRRKAAGQDVYTETVSTYRIFSRAFCNFVFPKPVIVRPMPLKAGDIGSALEQDGLDEDMLDAKSIDELLKEPDGKYTAEDREAREQIARKLEAAAYAAAIQEALTKLEQNADKYLSRQALATYSPKFLAILDNISSPENIGCNLVYSQFRTLEGIGILALVFQQNGFARLKLVKNSAGIWRFDMAPGDLEKPKFVLYTGTEDEEEKEIVRNIFNGEWNIVPRNLVEELEAAGYRNNNLGEVVKIFMITASGAEGIDLKNVRYVHLTEPYWHPVRIEQVIGRARRICSHAALPENLRTVEVFLYLMEFSENQLTNELSIELRQKDKSKLDNITPLTTDQAIYEIATIKEDVNSLLLTAVKEASVDCVIHSKAGAKEGLKCFTFGGVTPDKFATAPSIAEEETDAVAAGNRVKLTWKAKTVTVEGIKYAYREDTGELYDLQSFKDKNPVLVGNLEKKGTRYVVTWI